jgi:hypothetical protein
MRLPERTPQWIVAEIGKTSVKQWLDRHVPKRLRLEPLRELAKKVIAPTETSEAPHSPKV